MNIKHGTRGGYYAHRREGTPSCEACRAAINEYVQEYRSKTDPARNRKREGIRRRALAELREIHRAEYEELVDKHELIADLEEDL